MTLDSFSGEIGQDKMMEWYEETFKTIEEGQIVNGHIMRIDPDYVIVDVGYKSEGIIPLSEFSEDELRAIQPGNTIEVYVEEKESGEGNIVLSKEKARRIRIWGFLENSYRSGTPIEGKIIKKVKGGLSVDIGIKAFLPGSQVDIKPVKDMGRLVGETCQVKILKMDSRRGNVVVSRRAVIEEHINRLKQRLIEAWKNETPVEGVVKNITDYGVFIDLGGIDGLLHITDISWSRISHPSEVFKVGDRVSVRVLKYDSRTDRVSLIYKSKEDPWEKVGEKYPVGTRVRGRVTGITDFGAFVHIEDGVEGLIHVSEMSWTGDVNPADIVRVGQEIESMVKAIDFRSRKISLSLKRLKSISWEDIKKKYPPGTVVEGKVRNITDFGAFVTVEDGVDGLVHISEMAWLRRIKHPSEVLRRGQKVKALVMEVNPEKKRMYLSLKRLTPDPWESILPRKYSPGTNVEGTVTRITDFGIFIELEEGVEGLIHMSEVDIDPDKRVKDVIKPGDRLWAKVIKMEPHEKKIGLSMKEYNREKIRKEGAPYMVDEKTRGKITIGEIVRKVE